MNNECKSIRELLPSLALGVLEADAHEQVTSHLSHCEHCRAQAEGYEAVVAQLGLAALRVAPPAALKQRLRQRIQAQVRPRVQRPVTCFARLVFGWPRLVAIGMLAGLALTLILGLSNFYLWRQMRTSGSVAGLERVHLVHLRPTDAAPGASGTLLMSKDGAWSLLVVQGLPALDAERRYQLWLIADGRRTSGGLFSVSDQGAAQMTVSSSRPVVSYDAFGITIEPRGGSPGPTGAKVLGGRLVRVDV